MFVSDEWQVECKSVIVIVPLRTRGKKQAANQVCRARSFLPKTDTKPSTSIRRDFTNFT
jgi:hypothetical protein